MDELRQAGQHTAEAARRSMEHVRDRAGDLYESGRERVKGAERRLEDAIQSAPLKSVLVAAGVGVLLACLWRRS